MSRSLSPPAVVTGVMACLVLLAGAFPGGAGAAAKTAGIVFVAPWPGAYITGDKVVVAGRLPEDADQVYFLLNGRPLEGFSREGPYFSGSFDSPKGYSEVEVRSGDLVGRLTFIAGLKAASRAPYTFHQPLLEGPCTRCHGEERKGGSLNQAAGCYQCHPPKTVMYTNVHGPVAAGTCIPCHDPHGSAYPALIRMQVKNLCTTCHDQPETQEHTGTSRSKVCTLCHNPHYGMSRALLRATF